MTNADKASIDIAPSASLLARCRSLARAPTKIGSLPLAWKCADASAPRAV